jgi:hypothetical protein
MNIPRNHFEQARIFYETDLNLLREYTQRFEHTTKALSFAPPYHGAIRKDGVTPGFHHQVRIALNLYHDRQTIQMAGLDIDEVIAEALLHDTYEENQHLETIELAKLFNARIPLVSMALNKIRSGNLIPTEAYYKGLLDYPEALIVKLYDRADNVHTMYALPPEKMAKYLLESEYFIEISGIGIALYPKLESIIRRNRTEIAEVLNVYYQIVQTAAGGKMNKVVAAFREAGILTERRPPTLQDALLALPEGIEAIARVFKETGVLNMPSRPDGRVRVDLPPLGWRAERGRIPG